MLGKGAYFAWNSGYLGKKYFMDDQEKWNPCRAMQSKCTVLEAENFSVLFGITIFEHRYCRIVFFLTSYDEKKRNLNSKQQHLFQLVFELPWGFEFGTS